MTPSHTGQALADGEDGTGQTGIEGDLLSFNAQEFHHFGLHKDSQRSNPEKLRQGDEDREMTHAPDKGRPKSTR